MPEISVDLKKVLELVEQQRNAALNDVAILQARVADLEVQLQEQNKPKEE